MTPFSRRIEPELVEPLGYLLDVRMVEAGARAGESESVALARVLRDILTLQRRSFLPTEMLAAAVQRLSPAAAAHLGDFALTWRLGSTRDVPMGDSRARVIRVPQQAARFGICLHLTTGETGLSCSVEALDAYFEQGHVDRVATAFLTRLASICSIESIPKPFDDVAALPQAMVASTVSSDKAQSLASIWSHLIDTPVTSIGTDSHFLQSGGNSLQAMRLASQVQHQLGQKIDLGRFLANPTFGRLCAMVDEPTASDVADLVWLGRPDASDVVVLIPGFGGHVLGLYLLAEKLQARLGVNFAVAIADIESMLESAPAAGAAEHLTEQILLLLRRIGLKRVAGLVGFSLGSLLALRVAARLAPTQVLTCLIDGYAPRVMRNSWLVRLERRLGRRLLKGRPVFKAVTELPKAAEPLPEPRAEPCARTGELWNKLKIELSYLSVDVPNARVHLIQAQEQIPKVGLLWRRTSNGFRPGDFASWQVHPVDAMHLELPREFAGVTAQLVADCVSGARKADEAEACETLRSPSYGPVPNGR